MAVSGEIKNILRELKYLSYLSFHPFKGFWDIKKEKTGSLKTAVVIYVIFLMTVVMRGLYTGYIFNTANGVNFDIIFSISTVLVVISFWCIANWCLTCLFDGEGSFIDIVKATAYSLMPIILLNLISIPVSNFLALRELALYQMLLNAGYIWSGFLLLISVLVTHQYGLFKGMLMIFCIIISMCVIAYVALLFFNLIGQMWGFIVVIFKEVAGRV